MDSGFLRRRREPQRWGTNFVFGQFVAKKNAQQWKTNGSCPWVPPPQPRQGTPPSPSPHPTPLSPTFPFPWPGQRTPPSLFLPPPFLPIPWCTGTGSRLIQQRPARKEAPCGPGSDCTGSGGGDLVPLAEKKKFLSNNTLLKQRNFKKNWMEKMSKNWENMSMFKCSLAKFSDTETNLMNSFKGCKKYIQQ